MSSAGYRPITGMALGGGDLEARFRMLVQSPLRAGLLRFLSARSDETFDVEALMSSIGRMRLDVENCLKELTDFGVARRIVSGSQVSYAAHRPDQAELSRFTRIPGRTLLLSQSMMAHTLFMIRYCCHR